MATVEIRELIKPETGEKFYPYAHINGVKGAELLPRIGSSVQTTLLTPIFQVKDALNEQFYPQTHAEAVIGLAQMIESNQFFVKESDGNGGYRIKLKDEFAGLYANGWLAAGGIGQGGSGGGGASSLAQLVDVSLSNLAAGDLLAYDSSSNHWKNVASIPTSKISGLDSWVASKGYLLPSSLKTVNGNSLVGSGDITIADGQDGKSAYQIWLDEGNTGSEAVFLASLKGDTGVSADYPITIYNGLDSLATDQALAAVQGYILNQKITDLQQAGYVLAGVAAPSTDPGSPNARVFYVAEPGTYTHFGGMTIPESTIGFLCYDGGAWTADTVDVGKNYDGYLGITNGPAISATWTQSAYIDENGNIVPQANFTTKAYSVTGGKSYYISGLEAGNEYTCGWAAYNGATKVSYGANNTSANTAVARVPDDATILYVCQPNYGNLPAITVVETSSILDDIDARLDEVEMVVGTGGIVNIENIDVANYALLAETYVNKVWNAAGNLVDDEYQVRNSTSLVMIDKTKDITPGSEVYADVIFFDANKNYISSVQSYIYSPVSKANIPSNAVYMAFNYYRADCSAEDGVFYVSTRPYNTRLTKKLYATVNKERGARPRITISTTDSQETIFKKMVSAIYTEDCDVYFEKGSYSFDSIFYLMKSKYSWVDAFELPIGGNCRYYFNNSTLTGSYSGQTASANLVVEGNSSILGTHRLDGQTYELHDGTLVADGMVYCVHDEASGGSESYVHKYENMIMRYEVGTYTQGLSKCIGGGTGLAGEVVLNGCKFFNAHTTEDVSWHGHNLTTASVFKLFIANSFFVNGIGLHQLAANETGYLFLSASLVPALPSAPNWTVYDAGNTIR